MIINVGARTDIVNYYSEWLLERLAEGYVYSRNPLFPNKVTKYLLNPQVVDCLVFCSKNYQPLLAKMGSIAEQYRIYCHYTITAYGPEIEPRVPSIAESIATLQKLAATIGREKVAWRYDPIFLTEKYTLKQHLQTFTEISEQVAAHVDRCIINFIEPYPHLRTTMPELLELTNEDKRQLAQGLGKIAKKHNLKIQTCGNNQDYRNYGIQPSGCITAQIIGEANNCQFRKVAHSGMRTGCHCLPSRDLGAYDTCLNGCRYCYANKHPQKIAENYQQHDPHSPLLIGHLRPTDVLQNGVQKSLLVPKTL